MLFRRWPVLVVALGVGGTALAPDDAGADVTHDRVTTTFAGGGVHVLVVESRASLVDTAAWSRLRGRRSIPDRKETLPFDRTDPWTGEELPREHVTARKHMPLDKLDPWDGTPILLPDGAVALGLDSSPDPYSAD